MSTMNSIDVAKLALRVFARGIQLAYLLNLLVTQLGIMPSPLVHRVCNRLKMVGVYAAAHFAQMVDLQVNRDGAMSQFVEVAMRHHFVPATFTRKAVALRVLVSLVDVAGGLVTTVFYDRWRNPATSNFHKPDCTASTSQLLGGI